VSMYEVLIVEQLFSLNYPIESLQKSMIKRHNTMIFVMQFIS